MGLSPIQDIQDIQDLQDVAVGSYMNKEASQLEWMQSALSAEVITGALALTLTLMMLTLTLGLNGRMRGRTWRASRLPAVSYGIGYRLQ